MDFRAETAGTEKGEVLCVQGEMDPSIEEHRRLCPFQIYSPQRADLYYTAGSI